MASGFTIPTTLSFTASSRVSVPIVNQSKSCHQKIINFARKISIQQFFYGSKRKIQDVFKLRDRNPLMAIVIILAAIIALVLAILFYPVKLFLFGVTCSCHYKEAPTTSDIIPTISDIIPTIIVHKKPVEVPLRIELTSEETQIVDELKITLFNQIVNTDGKLRTFKINMHPDILQQAPKPCAFLKRLTEAPQGTKCDYNELRTILRRLNVYDRDWSMIFLPYFESLSKEDNSFPDKWTFPILAHFLLEALKDPKIPNDKKREATKYISLAAGSCKPTWGEAMSRALTKLYSTSAEGENQILIWVQEFKETLLLQEHENIACKEEIELGIDPKSEATRDQQWHAINGMKAQYGESLGLVTHHLQKNLRALTQRQASLETEKGRTQYRELYLNFYHSYQHSSLNLIQSVYKAFLEAEAHTQNVVRDYALSSLQKWTNLPGTTAHIELFNSYLINEVTCDLNQVGIAYLLYILNIIAPEEDS
ncbi:DUF1548 domain-containing protein [Candidatus Chlamydia sanziniae]|uniref:Uncharacterized protein n=1 Tax=Candidatus Chlamydia sanziniae TaxID=1806891 RepID=A0A1A9HVN2_9CHLA|nr:DUF1548 domain-containing protein [Candidatus Chlamydia sanziniae]ANH78757.1 hypothetical protein Cs308_0587 [Candidatus Chlamydia sanziniae]